MELGWALVIQPLRIGAFYHVALEQVLRNLFEKFFFFAFFCGKIFDKNQILNSLHVVTFIRKHITPYTL